MGTESAESLNAKILALGMIVGNQVLGSDKNATTPSQQMYVDSDSRLQTGSQQPFALGARQSTVGAALFTLSGKAVTDVLTGTIVAGASVTTATKGAFVRVDVTTDDGTVAGSYYVELFTIT